MNAHLAVTIVTLVVKDFPSLDFYSLLPFVPLNSSPSSLESEMTLPSSSEISPAPSSGSFSSTRSLVAVEPRRPPLRDNVGSETAFRHDHCKHIKKREVSLSTENPLGATIDCCINFHFFFAWFLVFLLFCFHLFHWDYEFYTDNHFSQDCVFNLERCQIYHLLSLSFLAFQPKRCSCIWKPNGYFLLSVFIILQ